VPPAQPNSWVLSIDFGTSNTAAAHTGAVSDSIEALQLSHDRTTMSSAVFVESPRDVDTGNVAYDKAQRNPSGYLASPKRTVAQGTTFVNGYDVPAHIPIGAVLGSAFRRAIAAHDGQPPRELVLTHPEAWTEGEIEILLRAASELGLDPQHIRTVSEPRAAAAYYSRGSSLSPGDSIGVFDFGGGTLDVAVLRATGDGTFDVVAARGDNQVGGKNFDARIRAWVDEQLEDSHPGTLEFLRTHASVEQIHALNDSIRRAKELLSETRTATISIPSDGENVRVQVTRDEFESIIDPTLRHSYELTRDTLIAGGVSGPSDLKALYLTGGSSRIPAVHSMLAALGPIARLDDPKTVVAQGALATAVPVLRGLGAGSKGPYGSHAPGTRIDPDSPGNAPSATGASRKRRGILVGAAAVVVVLVLAVSGFFAVRGFGSNDGTGPTAAGPTDSDAPLVDTQDILDALPQKLSSEIDGCNVDGSTTGGGREVMCTLVENSPLIPTDTDSAGKKYVWLAVDKSQAESEILNIRDGSIADTSDEIDELIENSARDAATRVVGVEGNKSDPLSIRYANTRTGILLKSSDFYQLDDVKIFLNNAGLMA